MMDHEAAKMLGRELAEACGFRIEDARRWDGDWLEWLATDFATIEAYVFPVLRERLGENWDIGFGPRNGRHWAMVWAPAVFGGHLGESTEDEGFVPALARACLAALKANPKGESK